MFHRLAAAALVAGMMFVPATAQADASCQDVTFPVSVAGLQQTMAGTLCVPANARTLQVLVPGGFYNRSYWDITVDPAVRSFRLAMNDAGYATLAVDRLGTGRSSQPPSLLLSAIVQANAVHQVVQAMRPRFDRVVLGGHSLGSAVSIIEAATYHDVDGVLVTSMGHHLNVLGVATIATSFVPAVLDPAFRGRPLDPGYLTTRAGTRYSLHQPGPNVTAAVGFDEATKDVAAPGELVDAALLGTVTPYTRLVDVPVLTAIAGGDPTFCGPLATDCGSSASYLAAEAPFYGPGAHLEAYVLPGYGHSFNYAPNAPDLHAAVVAWADRTAGR
ncbi:alpha/beta hydrolase [Actinophytocola oryzae]|uniref:Alpha/beta hydrolase family protein n=1 Tax=Actinophytocola oryzae TaxID=502181 RepID=A0A4V3FTP3_9PSEU|nr:alpha/beta fold hydrolase [Actinophytocola oryzae]TDV52061.1 alpha/beta hydrolase family protein [Actinophytocola oryzae]